MIALLAPIAQTITATTTMLNNNMANNYTGSAPAVYARTSNDAKITYIPNDSTQIFGKYSTEPFQVLSPQELGAAGGGTFDGGQPGAGHGHIQNVGMGVSHVFSPKVVMDADFGYTRQWSGAESIIDLSLGNYGLTTLHIPGTNSTTNNPDYFGQPPMVFNGTFSTIGNSNFANPFLFRDNQFTGDVNLSYVRGKHQFKTGFTYYHFDLNHFQPTTGGGASNVHGGFVFAGGMTCGGSSCGSNAYGDLADYLLGLPNNSGSGTYGSWAIQKAQQVYDPNALRWTELGAYAQDQWSVSPKLTVTYGVRFERYPAPYRDHTGISEVYVNRPQTSNVEVGGVMGNPKSAGVDMGYGFFAPRVGIAYRLNDKTVIRTGAGMTVDPDNARELRDEYPFDIQANYNAPNGFGTIAIDPATGSAMPLTYGIPIPAVPNYTSGFVALPVSQGTNALWPNFRRGYIESWNLFVQREVGLGFVANVGYVGDLFVRQQTNVSPYNAAPLPSASTPCMANAQWNTNLTGLTGACTGGSQPGTNINQVINWSNAVATGNWTTAGLYNTGGITMNGPLFSANYNGLQGQVTRNTGKNASLGLVYTYSHAFNYADNGAGTGSSGPAFAYPGYYKMNRAQANQDQKHNVQIWGMYKPPFGYGQKWANTGVLSEILGGWQVTGQYSYFGGLPFSVTANSNTLNAPGSTLYAQLVAPYQTLHGHERIAGDTGVSGGKPWFNPASFANPVEPAFSTANTSIASPVFANTHRNQFRGPGTGVANASMYKGFRVYRTSEFKLGVEVFNLFNHPYLNLNNPQATVPTTANVTAGNYGTFGRITAFGQPYSQTAGARSMQFSGKFVF
jgi:hypothetical protein